jgi:hypothetical protein
MASNVEKSTVRRFSLRTLGLVLVCLALCGISDGCEDPSKWTLTGEVKFINLRETTDSSGAKKATLEYSIRNGGVADIASCTFAYSFSTDKAAYHGTVVDSNAVKAGAFVYGRVEVAYDDDEEKGLLEAAVVDSMQFS